MSQAMKWGIDPYNRTGTKHLWERWGTVGRAACSHFLSSAKWEAIQPPSQALHTCKRCAALNRK